MIDPQGQAGKFIKALAAKKFEGELTVVKLTDKNMLRAMENAVRFGRWVLLENIAEEIDPAVEPLLVRQIIMVQGTPHIRLGDTNVPFNDNFRLFITTKLPNPHFAPELQVKVTLLNFTITPQGLEDQMLGTVVARENPELEQKKNELVIQNARMKAQLESIESQILKLLSETKGDILEDEALIETLSASKKTSAEIQDRVVESAQVEKEIDDSRRAYAPVAQRASTLFFCIADLAHADPMYQYSLQWFVQLFVNTIPSVPQADNLSDRLQLLSECFTRALYDSICRSLFEHHKLLFSFLLAVRVLQAEGRIGAKEWRFLVASSPPSRSLKNPAPAWLTDSTWAQIVALSDLEKFADFEVDFVEHLPLFRRYFDSATPHLERLPDKWEARLDGFLKLLVLKCLRPDKMSDAILSWVAANLGKEYTEFPPFSIQQSFAASTSSTPLIFILSRGADPAAELFAFAEDMGCSDKMKSISLGQGQGAVARKYIEEAMKSGGWVLLQNCHLAISWLPTLERLCEDIKPELVHANFRLWLTSLPTPKFPVSILQNGVKMTNEPPKGLRSNLMRSYLGFTDDALNDCKQPVAFKKLLYSLCLFHAVILDRKKFGPLGWNIPYEFTENDLQVCVTQLREFLNMYDEVPYEVIRFMTHDIHYGGRVTDDVDRRTIATILSDFIKPEVLRDDYAFTQSGKYKSLAVGSRQHYLDAIRALELVPQPEVFGMHENADITSARSATAAMFNTILALMPRAAAEDGRSSEDVVTQTAQQVLDSLPPNFDCEAISRNFPTVYTESMNTVLLQETIRYNRLLSMMRSTLADLLKALKGLMVMTEPLEKMATALFNNQVPEQWSSVAYPSLMPLATWVSDLHARLDFVQQWITKGTPAVFWISGFFFPQAFLTGALQNFARKHKCAIDAVSFSFHVLDSDAADIHRGPEDGIYVRGLFIEGARWDSASQCLADSRPKELFTSFPVIWLLPQVNRVPPHSDSVYTCPVYKITTRCGTLSTTGHSTNFVLNVELPTRDAPSKWIKAGVALFCALSY
jgi:dynein heavy chain